jgi:hypothetical protein
MLRDKTITLRLALFATLMTLANIGLAVLGWGGFDAFFSHPAWIAATVILIALSAARHVLASQLVPIVRQRDPPNDLAPSEKLHRLRMPVQWVGDRDQRANDALRR